MLYTEAIGTGQLQATVLLMQMLEVATTAAELRRLLNEGGLPVGQLCGFRDAHLENLLDKGLSTLQLLAKADEAVLIEPPPLPRILRQALLDKFNPAAPTASTGGSCSTCCI